MISKFFSRVSSIVLALVAGVFCFPAQAMAQQPGDPPPTHDQVIPYIFVVFCILLGIILTCRSAGRSKDVKIDHDD